MKKILTVKLASLGDIILFTPVLEELNKENNEIYHLVSKNCSRILFNNEYLKKIIEIDELNPAKGKIYNLLILIKIYFKLRRYNFDEIYLFHRNKILVKLFMLLKPKKLKYWGEEDRVINLRVEEFKFDLDEHRIYRHLKLINKNLKYQENNFNKNIKLTSRLDEISSYEVPNEEYIVISPGGGSNLWSDMKSRRWKKENYLEIIKKITKKVILVGGESDAEICKEIEEKINDSKKILNLCGKLKLEDTAKIIKNCKIFIGNDSMTLFLANSYDVDSIGIFTSTSGKIIMSLDREYIQSKCKCSPCYNPQEGTGNGIAYTCETLDCTEDQSIKIRLEKILKAKKVMK